MTCGTRPAALRPSRLVSRLNQRRCVSSSNPFGSYFQVLRSRPVGEAPMLDVRHADQHHAVIAQHLGVPAQHHPWIPEVLIRRRTRCSRSDDPVRRAPDPVPHPRPPPDQVAARPIRPQPDLLNPQQSCARIEPPVGHAKRACVASHIQHDAGSQRDALQQVPIRCIRIRGQRWRTFRLATIDNHCARDGAGRPTVALQPAG